MKTERSSGILLHITSLPGKEGIGSFGKEAYDFVDFLHDAGQKLWQILPLGPAGYGGSPYQCYSAFAGNPSLISLSELINDNLLEHSDLRKAPKFDVRKVLFEKVNGWKIPLLLKAFNCFESDEKNHLKEEYLKFIAEHAWWLNDYAMFMATKKNSDNIAWNKWDKGLKFRENKALSKYGTDYKDEVEFQKFLQFIFFRQWNKLKSYANSLGVKIVGDIPLYVSADSADVWANTDIFQLDEDLEPTFVGGVPPDYFSETGQLWGNPVFNWQRLKERNFDWWLARLTFNLKMYDLVRIDHFRGLESYWSVKAGEKTAENGTWEPALGYELLEAFGKQNDGIQLIAEDLGVITEEVEKLRDDFRLPGMKVLQFAFSSDKKNQNLPFNYDSNFAVYTGTHDNDTLWAWYRSAKKEEKVQLKKYLPSGPGSVVQRMIKMAWSSTAKMAVIPLQDLFELGAEARMNIPGTATGNWGWRFRQNQLKIKTCPVFKGVKPEV